MLFQLNAQTIHRYDITDCVCNGGFEGDAGGPCTICPIDTFCINGELGICPMHSVSKTQSDSVLDCNCIEGYYGDNGGECTICPQNTYCPGGENKFECHTNSLSQQGSKESSACICKTGWYEDENGSCLSCPEGSWCHAGNSHVCPIGTSSPANSKSVQNCQCKEGYSGQSNGIECQSCAIGLYKTDIGPGTCTDCSENTFSVTPASSKSTDCLSCPANMISMPGSALLTSCKCQTGYFGTNGGSCDPCPKGTYQEKTGAAECSLCPAKHFQPDIGQVLSSTCKPCPFNSDADAGSGDYTDCGCIGGYYDKHDTTEIFM